MSELKRFANKTLIVSLILFLFNIFYIVMRTNQEYYNKFFHWVAFIGFAITLIIGISIRIKIKKK